MCKLVMQHTQGNALSLLSSHLYLLLSQSNLQLPETEKGAKHCPLISDWAWDNPMKTPTC